MHKESAAAQEKMRKIREEIDRNEERFRQMSDKMEKINMVDAEMAGRTSGIAPLFSHPLPPCPPTTTTREGSGFGGLVGSLEETTRGHRRLWKG